MGQIGKLRLGTAEDSTSGFVNCLAWLIASSVASEWLLSVPGPMGNDWAG